MHTSNPFRTQHGGLTLVEMLIVLCILGICAAMTVASAGNQDDLVAAAAARRVMADWSYTQAHAVAYHKKTFIQHADQGYIVQTRDSATTPLRTLVHPVTRQKYVVSFNGANGSGRGAQLAAWNFGSASIVGFDEAGCPFAYEPTSNSCVPLTSSGSLTLLAGSSRVVVHLQPFTGELVAD